MLSGVIEHREQLQAQSRCSQPQEPDLDDITSWLENTIPELDRLLRSDPAVSLQDMEAKAKELKVSFMSKGLSESLVYFGSFQPFMSFCLFVLFLRRRRESSPTTSP